MQRFYKEGAYKLPFFIYKMISYFLSRQQIRHKTFVPPQADSFIILFFVEEGYLLPNANFDKNIFIMRLFQFIMVIFCCVFFVVAMKNIPKQKMPWMQAGNLLTVA